MQMESRRRIRNEGGKIDREERDVGVKCCDAQEEEEEVMKRLYTSMED